MKKAAIIGCGSIAGFLDAPGQDSILTHAHAYMKHDDTKLIAVCDPSLKQRESFVRRWGKELRHYDCVREMLLHEKVDIVSICSPTAFHFEALQELLKNEQVQAILCEKPFVRDQEEFDRVLPLLRATDKRLSINFLRRYDPSHQRLKKLIRSRELGELLHFSGSFSKGLYHNGSHMLELIEHLCGKLRRIQVNRSTHRDDDLYGTFYLETSSTRGVLQNESGEHYSLFELEIVLSKGRIKILDSGHTIEIETLQDSNRYPGYFSLKLKEILEESMRHNLLHSLDYLLHGSDTASIFREHLELSQKLLAIKAHLYEKNILEFT